MDIKQYASEFARLGGKTITEKKSEASRRNGTLGGRPIKKRYYFHGDKHETDEAHYCAFCDSFEQKFLHHVHGHRPECNEYRKYAVMKKFFHRISARFYRPLDADKTNLVA